MKSSRKYCILDCYVDEPACFGVPPFISPYPRYVFGALLDAQVDAEHIIYRTIDMLRANQLSLDEKYEAVFIIGGAVVPGKYLRARIGTVREIHEIIARNPDQKFFIGGAIGRSVIGTQMRNAYEIRGDIEFFAHSFAKGAPAEGERSALQISRWAVRGAAVVKYHPEHPHLICEIETYRGCPRQSKCHFCQEFLRHGVDSRDEMDILREIDALVDCGITRFRLGCQPDILQFGSHLDEYRNGFPRPNAKKAVHLFNELHKRRKTGAIVLLNVDNANPGSIVHFPDESSEILHAITEAISPGDTLALGIESFDEAVVSANNLKVKPKEAITAIEIINSIGGTRVDGIPVLLPGINLIHGLVGESETSFQLNFEYLKKILEMGLLVKRINIRSINPIEGTPAGKDYRAPSSRVQKRYEYYREKIREEIDKAMLRKIYPAGTVLKGLRIENIQRTYAYARQIASYPITAKIPFPYEHDGFFDAVIIGHHERSVIAAPKPFDINTLPHSALKHIPGLGKKGIDSLILARPLDDLQKAKEMFPNVPEWLWKLSEKKRNTKFIADYGIPLPPSRVKKL